MAIIIVTFAQKGSDRNWMGCEMMDRLTKNWLIIPSPLNKYLNSIEYATSEVTAGKNIAILKNPLNFRVASFNNTEKTKAKRIIIGTCMIK